MSVVIEPSEQLEFHGPFTRSNKESLFVKNPSSEPIIFKVKTTAPKQYAVRPNAGRIEPFSEIEVQIILQPFKEELGPDYKCKDKFLVQTAPILPSFDQQDITNMWSHIEKEEKASLHQHKIKCAFVIVGDGGDPKEEQLIDLGEREVVEEVKNNVTVIAAIPESSVVSSTPAITSTSTTITREIPAITVPSAYKEKEPSTAVPDVTTTNIPTEVPPTASASDTTTNKPEDNTKEEELKEALAKIKQLELQLSQVIKEKEALQQEGLRSRLSNSNNNNTSTSTITTTNNNSSNNSRKLASTVQPLDAVHQHLAQLEKPRSIDGYPPQVVLGVALLVFIFTYLFF